MSNATTHIQGVGVERDTNTHIYRGVGVGVERHTNTHIYRGVGVERHTNTHTYGVRHATRSSWFRLQKHLYV